MASATTVWSNPINFNASITTGINGGGYSGPAIPFVMGGTNLTAVPASATASNYAAWDASVNLGGNAVHGSFTTTVSSATTTLTVASTEVQVFTGSTANTITLPVVSTLKLGHQFTIVNNSSATITINSSGATLIGTIFAGNAAYVVANAVTGTTTVWNIIPIANPASSNGLTVGSTATTTMVYGGPPFLELTGTVAQTVTLPTCVGTPLGTQYMILNNGTSGTNAQINVFGGASKLTMFPLSSVTLTVVGSTDVVASWFAS